MTTMQKLKTFLLSPRFPFITTLIIATPMVGGGVLLQQTLHIAACPLCISQRMLAMLLFSLSVIGLLISNSRAGRMTILALMLATTATGAFVAGYQTWLQRFAHDTTCSGQAAWWELLIDWAGEKIPILFYASGLCSDPAFKFIGLSIAEWSLVIFSALTVMVLRSLLRRH
ncbi:MAG: disulfide bond formation protein B [Proteobacteria bacterium]|nr:disulfide bond formation protein B [Pseudomonadota bacterium]